ncbi:hypothetical protein JCM24511_01081 [Saitozyma sp. JCM 24511]|nr:hypothetical protein JCM24511_01081 [Saitozyma sp. JCM 24511]
MTSAPASDPVPVVTPHLRVARPVTDLALSSKQYTSGLGLSVLFSFSEHAGFSGIMLGHPTSSAGWHLELTVCHAHAVKPHPTPEDLLVLYLPDRTGWAARCAEMESAGWKRVESYNPYWDDRGRTFEDRDGYRVVIANMGWTNEAAAAS